MASSSPTPGPGAPALRLAVLAAVLVGAAVTVALVGDVSVGGLREAVDGTGWAAPVTFVVLYAVLTVLFVPGSVLTAAAGVLFGVVVGTALTVLGATLGATGAFLVARRLGRDAVARLTGARMERVDRWLGRRGFLAVLYVRLLPLLPFNAVNYVAGVTGVGLRPYALATAVGIVPGAFAFAALGGSLDDPTSPAFLGAVALVVLLAATGPWLARRVDPPDGDATGRVDDAVADTRRAA